MWGVWVLMKGWLCCGGQAGVTIGAADKHFTSLQQIDGKP
jgi:hypothetical protein